MASELGMAYGHVPKERFGALKLLSKTPCDESFLGLCGWTSSHLPKALSRLLGSLIDLSVQKKRVSVLWVCNLGFSAEKRSQYA